MHSQGGGALVVAIAPEGVADDVADAEVVINEDIYAEPPTREEIPPPADTAMGISPYLMAGYEPFPEVVGPIWKAMNEREGTSLRKL